MADTTISEGWEISLKQGLADLKDAINPPEVLKPLQNSVAAPTSGTTFIDLGSPSQAVEWDLRALTLTGADDHTVQTSITASLYIASTMTAGDPPTLQQIVWTLTGGEGGGTNTIPLSDRWKDQIRIPGGQHLYVVLSGTISAGTAFTASAFVSERARTY